MQMKDNDLNKLDEIIENPNDIDWYLSNVSIEQFRKDVEYLMKRYVDKSAIKEAIFKLTKLLHLF